jgi:hypothetical protein
MGPTLNWSITPVGAWNTPHGLDIALGFTNKSNKLHENTSCGVNCTLKSYTCCDLVFQIVMCTHVCGVDELSTPDPGGLPVFVTTIKLSCRLIALGAGSTLKNGYNNVAAGTSSGIPITA